MGDLGGDDPTVQTITETDAATYAVLKAYLDAQGITVIDPDPCVVSRVDDDANLTVTVTIEQQTNTEWTS